MTEAKSYHDVFCEWEGNTICMGDSYGFELSCTKVTGWVLYAVRAGQEPVRMASEYDVPKLSIRVGNTYILGNKRRSR